MTPLSGRYDIVYIFDVKDGNPNGDPDAGNMPRMDPENSQGLMSDVSLKRKIRDYIDVLELPGSSIFVRSKEPLNPKIAKACEVHDLPTFRKSDGKWDTKLAKERSQEDIRLLQEWLCAQYFDIRSFGAVMSTGPNAGQVRGPVQFTFARSVERVLPMEVTITRVADVDKEEGEMGRKHIVPYGLYRAHIFVNASLAARTGFGEEDVARLMEALRKMFEHDRSAARGEMTCRRVIAFKHFLLPGDQPNAAKLGKASAHSLFDRVHVKRKIGDDLYPLGDPRLDNARPARHYTDYDISIDREGLPDGIEIIDAV
jgi:CRISPR-associated protein Csd2